MKLKISAFLATVVMVLYFGTTISTDYFSKAIAGCLFALAFFLIVVSNIYSMIDMRRKKDAVVSTSDIPMISKE